MYKRFIKRLIDIVLSLLGIFVLAIPMLIVAIIIKVDDPGPALFKQKRVGINKSYFQLYKFRSMKLNTPDIPTHLLENPEQYLIGIGALIRKLSIDELPQLFNILKGDMSIIGPRPALWNQDDLIVERDKYGANDVKPGLTGWAQINGRDELEIPAKAKLDGEYVEKLNAGKFKGVAMDVRCFFGTFFSVLLSKGIVEGGTGAIERNRSRYTCDEADREFIGYVGFGEKVDVDKSSKKKILITGKGSYIGNSFREYACSNYKDNFVIDELDMMEETWKETDFSNYDIIYHVAGIAHADVGNVSDEVKEKYYQVNTDLAVQTAKKAKDEGVKMYVFMSSMIVYGDSAPYGKKKIIDENTVPIPKNFYGDSKLQADVAVRNLADENFKVIVLRPPMIYGPKSKGNYCILAKVAKKLPLFPLVENERSMLFIENLCEFLCQIMLVKKIERNSVVLFPQNAVWSNTSSMVREIAKVSRKRIRITKVLLPVVLIAGKVKGRIGELVNKAFGNCCYEKEMSMYPGISYQCVSLEKSIELTEGVR